MTRFVVAHPAITVACPGTGDPELMVDNVGGGRGAFQTDEHVRRIVELEQSVPSA